MYRNLLFLSLLCFITLTCKAQSSINDISVLVNKTPGERMVILANFYEREIVDLDSVFLFSKFKAIEKLANEANDLELLEEVKLMQVHYFQYRPYFSKAFKIAKIKKLDERAKKKKLKWLEARTQSLLANFYYHHIQEYSLGFEHYQKTASLISDYTPYEFPLKQICLYQIGRVYYDFQGYTEAKKYFLSALNASSKFDRYYYKMNLLNDLALCYNMLHDLDSSKLYFNQLLKASKIADDRLWEGIALGNIGANYIQVGELEKAEELLRENSAIAREYKDWALFASGQGQLAKIKLKQGKMDEAKDFALKARKYVSNSWGIKTLASLYPILAKISAFENNPSLSALYLDSTLMTTKKVAKVFNNLKLIRASQKIKLEQYKQELEFIDIKKEKRNLLLGSIIFALAFTLLIIFLLFNRQKLNAKNKAIEGKLIVEKLKTTEFEKLKLEQEIEMHRQEVSSITLSMIRKNEQVERFKKDIAGLNYGDEKAGELKRRVKENEIADKDWTNFNLHFGKIHPEFYNKMAENCPDCTENELRLACLMKLNISTREIAEISGVNIRSVDQSKYRLKKKIIMEEDLKLTDFIREL